MTEADWDRALQNTNELMLSIFAKERVRLANEWRSMSEEAREKWLNSDVDALKQREKMTPEEYYFYKRYQLDA